MGFSRDLRDERRSLVPVSVCLNLFLDEGLFIRFRPGWLTLMIFVVLLRNISFYPFLGKENFYTPVHATECGPLGS